MTHLPVASMRVAPAGMVTFAPTAVTLPFVIRTVPCSIFGPLTGYTLPPVMAIVCAPAVAAHTSAETTPSAAARVIVMARISVSLRC